MIDPDSGVPVYRQVADAIRAEIESGRLRPGQRLRTEPEYVDEFDVGRDTVRKAMAALRAEGLIVTTKQGSRVRPLTNMAKVPVRRDTLITTRMPTLQERRALDIPEGVPVFVIEEPGSEPRVLAGDRARLIVDG